MLTRFIYDTSSFQDRLIQSSIDIGDEAKPPTRNPNKGQNNKCEHE